MEVAGRDKRIAVLDSASAEAFVDRLAAKFVIDRNRTWWWDSLRDKPQALTYGSGDGLAEVKPRIESEAEAMLVVTDDDPDPQGVLELLTQ